MNLGYPDSVCDQMMNKALYNITCSDESIEDDSMIPATAPEYLKSTIAYRKDSIEYSGQSVNNAEKFNSSTHDFAMEVCRAETESQKLGSTISGYMAPFGKVCTLKFCGGITKILLLDSTIGIFLVLFAGSWSDKTGKRKPCILIPHVGDGLAQLGERQSPDTNILSPQDAL